MFYVKRKNAFADPKIPHRPGEVAIDIFKRRLLNHLFPFYKGLDTIQDQRLPARGIQDYFSLLTLQDGAPSPYSAAETYDKYAPFVPTTHVLNLLPAFSKFNVEKSILLHMLRPGERP